MNANYHLIRETYHFLSRTDDDEFADSGRFSRDWDMFKIAIDYKRFRCLPGEVIPHVRLLDDWVLPGNPNEKAAHYKQVYKAIAYGLTTENLFSKTYLFEFPDANVRELSVEIRSGGGIFMQLRHSFFEDYSAFTSCLDYIKTTVEKLQFG